MPTASESSAPSPPSCHDADPDAVGSAAGVVFRAAVSVTYTAVLDVSEDSVLFLSGLLHAERRRRGTRKDTRALSTYRQAVLDWRVWSNGLRVTLPLLAGRLRLV